MISYLVSPPEKTDWKEDPTAFSAALQAQWPDAQIKHDPPESPMALSFEFKEFCGEKWVSGQLFRNGQAVSIDGDVPAAAAIAAWWRQRIPSHIRLVFYDESYNTDVPVEPGVDAAALAAAYVRTSGDLPGNGAILG